MSTFRRRYLSGAGSDGPNSRLSFDFHRGLRQPFRPGRQPDLARFASGLHHRQAASMIGLACPIPARRRAAQVTVVYADDFRRALHGNIHRRRGVRDARALGIDNPKFHVADVPAVRPKLGRVGQELEYP